jgi:hypothetical protein
MGRSRAARAAGAMPPTRPITSASASAVARSLAPTRSWITLVVKVAAPNAIPPSHHETRRPSSAASDAPIAKPPNAITSDSTRNDTTIDSREKPSARNVPISARRDCTAA